MSKATGVARIRNVSAEPSMTRLRPPPKIRGLDFSEAEILAVKHREPPGLIQIDVDTSMACDLRCVYCFSNAGKRLADEMTFDDICRVLEQARELGARLVVVVGGGEPFCYPELRRLFDRIDALQMSAIVYTNMTKIDEAWASYLWDRQIAVAGKINSFDAAVFDRLLGVDGASAKAYRALELLQSVGYPGDPARPLLAIESVILKPNIHEMPRMWRYCRDHGIIPYFEMVKEQGRTREHTDLLASSEEVMELFCHLLEIDESEYGLTWVPMPPIAAHSCTRHRYAAYIGVCGDLYPCPGVELSLGNIKINSLAELLDCEMIRTFRYIEQHLEGRCGSCELAASQLGCYGCRGQAWQTTGSITAEDPGCRLYRPVQACGRKR